MNPAGDDQGTGGADSPAEDTSTPEAPAEGDTTGGKEGGAE